MVLFSKKAHSLNGDDLFESGGHGRESLVAAMLVFRGEAAEGDDVGGVEGGGEEELVLEVASPCWSDPESMTFATITFDDRETLEELVVREEDESTCDGGV